MISFVAGHRAHAGSSLMRSIMILFAVVGWAGASIAQQQFYFKNLTERDGLSNNSVTCFLQDREGFMWIGTESGLNRFNGNSWTHYQPTRDKAHHISNGYITSIKQDEQGKIWVATRRGLNCIDPVQHHTEAFLPGDEKTNTIPSDLIWDIAPAKNGGLWIAPDAKGLCYYDPATKIFTRHDFWQYVEANGLALNKRYHSVFRILTLTEEQLILATTDGIFLYEPGKRKYTQVAPVALTTMLQFTIDHSTGYLHGVDNGYSIVTVNLKDLSWRSSVLRPIPAAPFPTSLGATLPDLILPSSVGLVTLSSVGGPSVVATGAFGMPYQLLPRQVQSVYKDRQGIYWIGTRNGVSRFIPQYNKGLHVTLPDGGADLLPRSVRSMVFDPSSDHWLIAQPGKHIILQVNDGNGMVTEWNRPAAMRRDTCYAFFDLGEDTLYLLSRGVVQVYSRLHKTWARLALPVPYHNAIYMAMAVDPSGCFWLVNQYGVLIQYDPSTHQARHFSDESIGSLSDCLVMDKGNHCLWIGTTGVGLFRFDLSTEKFLHFDADLSNAQALPSYIINDILMDAQGNLWLAGFEGGLSMYKTALPPDKGFTNYNSLNGLRDNNVYGLQVDARGGIWFTTIKGIGHLDSNNRIEWYNEETGLPVSSFHRALVVQPGGAVAAISGREFVRFQRPEPDALQDRPVVIHQVNLHDTILLPVQGENLVHRFTHTQDAFTFHFATLDYASPEAVQYAYQLEGFDREWVQAGNQHIVRYSNLAPGSYTFRVRSMSSNGQVYPLQGRWAFSISPPFWKTIWFRLLIALVLITALVGFFRSRLRTVRKEAVLQQRVMETEMMALRAQMNPHFIFNCLNSIESLIETDQKEKATRYLSKFARLIRFILEHAQSNAVPLWKDLEVLKLYISLEELRFDGKFTWEIKVDPGLSEGDFKVPPMVVQPFVENAIHHGLLNKLDADRKLEVDVTLHGESICYLIEDNGIGRQQSSAYQHKRDSIHHSMGIEMARERIRLFNGKTTGEVTITDLYHEDGKPAGTRVKIELVKPG